MVEGDLRRRIRPLRVFMSLLTLVGVVAVAGYGAVPSIAAERAVAECGNAILRDWRADGAVGQEYDPECYYEAIDALPEDVRTYTSAEDDITRALQVHVDEATSETPRGTSSAEAPTPMPSASSSLRLPPLPVLVLGAVGVVLLAGALGLVVPAAARRR